MSSERNLKAIQADDIYDPFLYPWMCLNFFLAFWLLSGLVRRGIYHVDKSNMSKIFDALREDIKRNVIAYVLEFWVTLLAFVLQIYGASDILFRLSESTTATRLNCMVFAVLCTVMLYVWELCYREKIGWPLLLHRVIALLFLQCLMASFYETGNILYLRYAVLLAFHATTEQIGFLALFCFRLGIYVRHHAVLCYAAALQACLFKTVATLAALIFFIRDAFADDAFGNDPTSWNVFWKISFLPLLAILYGSDLYACKIFYSLGSRCSQSNKLVEDVVREARLSKDLKELSQALEHGTRETRRHRERGMWVVDAFENSASIRPSMATNPPTLASHERAREALTSLAQRQNAWNESIERKYSDEDELDPAQALRVAVLAHTKAEEITMEDILLEIELQKLETDFLPKRVSFVEMEEGGAELSVPRTNSNVGRKSRFSEMKEGQERFVNGRIIEDDILEEDILSEDDSILHDV